MKKLAVIGANDFQNQLILKAKELGYETHVFAWRAGAEGEKTADYFYPISITEKEEILEVCRRIRPDGICSIGSDLAVVAVSYVAEHLGLPCNPVSITHQCTNKAAMREAFARAGVPVPRFVRTGRHDGPDLSGFSFPVIVKPTDRSGSRAITRLETAEGLQEAVDAACEASFEHMAIIEEYLEGDEYSCECISQDGVHHFLAVTKKFTTGAPHFIETGHMEPAGLSAEQEEQVKAAVFAGLDALDIVTGASHSEFKLAADGSIRIIEIGARMGGDCIGSDLVELSTGNDFIRMVIDAACGRPISVRSGAPLRRAYVRFLLTQEDARTLERDRARTDITICRVSRIDTDLLGHTSDSSTRAGYYIYTEAL